MVLHFPTKLTDEEEALQLKYAKLRRKKKQLQEVRHETVLFNGKCYLLLQVNKPKQEPEQNKVRLSLF